MSKPLYSTDPSTEIDSSSTSKRNRRMDKSQQASAAQTFHCDGPLKIRVEKKGRGGKAVTVLYNLPMSKEEAKELKSTLSSKLGCGATVKNGTIEIQGSSVEKVKDILKHLGIDYKVSGASK